MREDSELLSSLLGHNTRNLESVGYHTSDFNQNERSRNPMDNSINENTWQPVMRPRPMREVEENFLSDRANVCSKVKSEMIEVKKSVSGSKKILNSKRKWIRKASNTDNE